MKSLIARNLKVFFRDRASVFYSLLSVIIIFGLYVLFLGDVWASNLPKVPGARALTDSWIMAGILAVASVTTVMGAFGTMVEDRANKIIKDFSASPISKGEVAGGYVLSSFLIGVMMTLVAFILSEVYVASRGGVLLTPAEAAEVLGLILLSTLCNTAMVSFLISFFKSMNAFGTASSILGTMIGFLTGIYLPIGMLPEPVQFFIKAFPVSHAALLIRRVMTEAPMRSVFKGAPEPIVRGFEEQMGIVFRFGGQALPDYVSILILAGTALLFYALSIARFSRKSR
jgi:multidrug/hemolysin transport system permease protein